MLMPELSGTEHRFVPLSTGVRAHVAVAGPPGAPVVLALHGWPQHWWTWRRVIPLLAEDFRVLAMDVRGLGWSSWPTDGDFTKQRIADDALALLDALGVARANLLGHDWGGLAAIRLALGAPERVRSLLAMGTGHPWVPRPRLALNAWRLAYQLPLATPLVGPALMRDGRVSRAALRAGWGVREMWDEQAAELYVASLRRPWQARAGSLLYRHFLVRELPAAARGELAGERLAMPARLMMGRRDPIGAALAEGFERRGAQAAVELIDGCGHFVPEERPQLVAERAREMFA